MGEDQKRAFGAIVLSGIILFAWQTYFAPKPQATAPMPSTTTTAAAQVPAQTATVSEVQPLGVNDAKTEEFTLSHQGYSARLSNALEVITMKGTDTVYDFNDVTGSTKPFYIEFENNGVFQKCLFSTIKLTNNSFEGLCKALDIKVLVTLHEDSRVSVAATSSKEFKYRMNFAATAMKLDNGSYREFSVYTNDLKRYEVGDEESNEGKLKWLGIDFNYHLFAVVLENKEPSFFKADTTTMHAGFSQPTSKLNFDFIFSKKEYDHLKKFGNNLELAVDFGMWSILAIPMLRILQFFYEFIPNYGLAIIFLTILMRIITFPLQYKSFKSMKKMQELQPQMNAIKEKFKNDPQRMQQETMMLFKRGGANPLGGCLPLLAQMPFFFAFYKMLYTSVELVGAPFIFWINDLSIKDPYFVLPALMAAAMFLQQKMTPSAVADPVQKKVLLFMPLIFGFIMSSLPAGLTLYIFISTVFGLISQVMVFKRI
ncbi:MAG: membrane protein insertase YidC [Bacteriovoracaceae bacterium]|nr:membrane protein insertase YidC [Bacteriovoracaceae bacterium]